MITGEKLHAIWVLRNKSKYGFSSDKVNYILNIGLALFLGRFNLLSYAIFIKYISDLSFFNFTILCIGKNFDCNVNWCKYIWK